MTPYTLKDSEPVVVAIMEKAPWTGGWMCPSYYYDLDAAERDLATNRRDYYSCAWRLRIVAGPRKGEVL